MIIVALSILCILIVIVIEIYFTKSNKPKIENKTKYLEIKDTRHKAIFPIDLIYEILIMTEETEYLIVVYTKEDSEKFVYKNEFERNTEYNNIINQLQK